MRNGSDARKKVSDNLHGRARGALRGNLVEMGNISRILLLKCSLFRGFAKLTGYVVKKPG